MNYLTFDDLTADQKLSLKQTYLCEHNESVSYGELADADSLVSDEELRNEYGGTVFSPEDF